MTLDILIMFAGAAIMTLPFLGIPLKWDNVLLVILGIFVVMLGIIVRRRAFRYGTPKGKGSFVESSPQSIDVT
jgi:membrane protein implicated in regulation of membrane protease activity